VMQSNGPEAHPAFAVSRVRHTSHENTGTTRVQLRPYLHSAHVTPRHALHHTLGPAPCRPAGHVHISRCSGQSLTGFRHTAEHDAHWHTRRIICGNGDDGWQRLVPMALVAWRRSIRKEDRCSLRELERASDLRALLRGWQRIAISAEEKRYASGNEVIGK
jgi:hypothetical protein